MADPGRIEAVAALGDVGQARTGDPRHRSLWATFDQSLGALGDDELRGLLLLGQFAGTFGLADAEALMGGDALPVLDRLRRHSLVALERVDGGAERYRIVSSLRVYLAERRALAPDGAALEAAFAGWIARLADALDAGAARLTPGS